MRDVPGRAPWGGLQRLFHGARKSIKHLTLQDADVVLCALEQFRKRPKVDFSDCLVLEIARKAGHLPLGTFDRDLSRCAGTQRLK